MLELLLKERRALTKKKDWKGVIGEWILFLVLAVSFHRWLSWQLLLWCKYVLYTPKKKPRAFYYMPLSEKEQKTYIFFKGFITAGGLFLYMFPIFLWNSFTIIKQGNKGLVILYSLLIALNFFLLIERNIIANEISEKYQWSVKKYLKKCVNRRYRMLFQSMTVVHVILAFLGLGIGFVFDEGSGILFGQTGIEAVVIGIVSVILLLLHYILIKELLNTSINAYEKFKSFA